MNRFSLLYPAIYILALFSILKEINGQTDTWQYVGPEGLHMNAIIKYDQFSKKLYLYGRKIFRSDNNGNSWINISLEYLGEYTDLLFTNENGSNGLYALRPDKIFKSTDEGKSWQVYYTDSIRRIIYIDEHNANILIAVKPSYESDGSFFQTIQKSTDAGKNWITLNNGIDTTEGPIVADVNPYFPENIIALQSITGGTDVIYNEKIFLSTNSGLSWTGINLDTVGHIINIVFDPQAENIFYINRDHKPWIKTTDGGNTWQNINNGLPVEYDSLSDLGLNIFSISPFNSNTLYIATTRRSQNFLEIFKSEDGGSSWNLFSKITPSHGASSILVDPQKKEELFVCASRNGIYHSRNKGKEWDLISKGFTQTGICSFSAFNSKMIYAHVNGSGLYRTTDGGQNWDLINKNEFYCNSEKITASSTNPNIVFTTTYINGNGFSISDDKGNTWRSYSYEGSSSIFDVASDNQTVLGAAYNSKNIVKSTNGGANWEVLNPGISDSSSVEQIKIDPFDKNIVYAVIWIRDLKKQSLIKTTDGGSNWKVIADTAYRFFINRYDSKNVYYTTGQMFCISKDKGVSFSKVVNDTYFEDIAFDSTGNGALYAITRGRIIKSVDNGFTWTNVDALQETSDLEDIELCYTDSGNPVLYGSTLYNGILKYDLLHKSSTTNVPRLENLKRFTVKHININPSNSTIMIIYQLTIACRVELKICNILGKEIACLVNKNQSPGRFEAKWDSKKFPSGNYFYSIKVGDFKETKKLMLVK